MMAPKTNNPHSPISSQPCRPSSQPCRPTAQFFAGKLRSALIAALALASSFGAIGCQGGKQDDDRRSSTITIRVVHGPELRAFLSSAREQFMVGNPRLPNGDPVRVELISEMGLTASQRIAKGDLKTEGWISPSTTLVDFANRTRINLGPEQTRCREIFRTPVVVAARPDQSGQLVPSGNTFSWERLFPHRRTSIPGAKAKPGEDLSSKPALGLGLSFSHGQPRASVTGLASLVELAYLAADNPQSSPGSQPPLPATTPGANEFSPLSDAVLERPEVRSALMEYQRSVFTYPLSESYLLSKTAAASGKRPRFAITTEQQLLQFNQQQSDAGMQLEAFFPQEGVYWEDYQLCASDADWVSPGHQAALTLFTDFLLTESVQKDATKLGFRGARIPGLPPESQASGAPSKYENAARNVVALPPAQGEVVSTLLSSWPALRRPAAFILVLDSSGSMEGDALNIGKEQFRSLLAHSSDNDLKALVTFNSTPAIVSDFTKDSADIIPKLDVLPALGGSGVYDGIKTALSMSQNANLGAYRKMIVVYTDGGDKNSDISLTSLLGLTKRAIDEADINLVIVAVDREGSDFSDLERIAETADGTFRRSALVSMDGVFQEVSKGF